MSEAQLFVVRVWRQADGFRASVRAVGEEQARLFNAAGQLACFLAETVDALPSVPTDQGRRGEGPA